MGWRRVQYVYLFSPFLLQSLTIKLQLRKDLIPILHDRRWLVSASMRCAPVRAVFLELYALLAYLTPGKAKTVPYPQFEAIRLAAQACDMPMSATASFQGVGVTQLRVTAASICARGLLLAAPDAPWRARVSATELLLGLLRDPVADVQAAVLEALESAAHGSGTQALAAVLELPAVAAQVKHMALQDESEDIHCRRYRWVHGLLLAQIQWHFNAW